MQYQKIKLDLDTKIIEQKLKRTEPLALLGPISIDYNVEPDGTEVREFGGAITYATHTVARLGVNPYAVVRGEKTVIEASQIFTAVSDKSRIIIADAKTTNSIRNQYFDTSHETRTSSLLERTDTFDFTALDKAEIKVHTYFLGGLIYGDFSNQFICDLAKRGQIALDAQCLLRHGTPGAGAMDYRDWQDKQTVLPHVTFFKVDAKEAEILTGNKELEVAAKQLTEWGAKEVFLSYHTQMLVFDGKQYYRCKYQPDSLRGRTGRGDTVFSAYITFRQCLDIPTSLLLATALVSIKMEAPGPFAGDLEDVVNYADRKCLYIERTA